jgi:hypothetical protein
MDYSVYKISLDIHKPEAQEVLEMKLLDSKRRIQISLTENGKVYQITPDCKAMFSAGKSDGNKIYNQCEIVDNTIIYDVTQQTLACLGEVDCEIQLIGSDEAVITSPRFSIIVHDRVYNGEDIVDSEMETNVLPDLIAKSHEHDNKEVLDGITQELLNQIGTGGGLTPEQAADLEANTAARHEHENKDILDSIGYDEENDKIYINGDGILTDSDAGDFVSFDDFSKTVDKLEGSFVNIDDYNSKVSTLESDIQTNRKMVDASLKYVAQPKITENISISSGIHYVLGEVETLTIDLEKTTDSDLARYRQEYTFTFISGATPTVLTLPDTVKWANELTIEANKKYEISIVDNIGLWCAVEVDV